MNKSTQAVLDEIEADRKRIASLTEEDFKNAYEKMKNSGFPAEAVLKFGYDIGSSQWVEYHYQVLCLDWNKGRYSRLGDWFHHHLESGYACLLAKLQAPSYQKYHSQTLILLAHILNGSYGDDAPKETYKQATRSIALADLFSPDDAVRESAALCLNSIGSFEDISALCGVLLTDPHHKCRAYAASALMHIASKTGDKAKTAENSIAALKKALEQEKDLYALASIIGTVQFLFSKKYIAAHITGEDKADEEKILEGGRKALRFLSKLPL